MTENRRPKIEVSLETVYAALMGFYIGIAGELVLNYSQPLNIPAALISGIIVAAIAVGVVYVIKQKLNIEVV